MGMAPPSFIPRLWTNATDIISVEIFGATVSQLSSKVDVNYDGSTAPI